MLGGGIAVFNGTVAEWGGGGGGADMKAGSR